MRTTLLLAAWVGCALSAQQAPKVVSLSPPHLGEVDAKTTTKLVVVFDQPMDTNGVSFCGGGPTFPPSTRPPYWPDAKTVVVEVELAPDHEYALSLNCPAASNFRAANGAPLAPVPWSFTTLPTNLRPAAAQKQRNQKALKQLLQTIDERYSHRDLRVLDWKRLRQQHEKAILAARTDRGFAAAAADMLRATEDLHLYLRCGDATFGTGSRAVDPLFRRPLLDRYVQVAPAGPQVLAGRTADGIGYLLIGAWTAEVDPEVAGGAITELADTHAMVIDVRPNSGGDELLAQRVAAWFVVGTHTYAKNRFRERPGKDGFGPVLERRITGLGEDRHYGKPIAVLTSRYVMSSNESFVLMLRQAPDCVTVGQPTYGSSGNPKPFELGNDVTVVVPTWQDLRLDGTCFEGEGLAPDVLVPCTAEDLASRDPILEQALALLRAKVKAAAK
ncbi:MAG: Ig-like domain-containing protein [Planctomycetes bacterium]|nr:Ig-like domain-containing protein [Planctomycetota bacterium]